MPESKEPPSARATVAARKVDTAYRGPSRWWPKIDEIAHIIDEVMAEPAAPPALATETWGNCESSHKGYEGFTLHLQTTDCVNFKKGGFLAQLEDAALPQAKCEVCDELLPVDSKYAVHDKCADELRAALKDLPHRTIEPAPQGERLDLGDGDGPNYEADQD